MSKCPVCRKTFEQSDSKPFCSKRCADLDLSRWLNGAYAIPGEPVSPDASMDWQRSPQSDQES